MQKFPNPVMKGHYFYSLEMSTSVVFNGMEPLFCFFLFLPLVNVRKEGAQPSAECEAEHRVIATKIKVVS